MRRIIVNADDFGLTAGVNRGIQKVFAAGGLSSATLMAGGEAAAEAAEIARSNPTLGVGCHVVLIDGKPVASARDVRSLLEPGIDHFYRSLPAFLAALYRGKITEEHIRREATAQLKRLRELGIEPTHVDTHKHTHVYPRVLRGVLSAASACGIRAIRNPIEPEWAVAASGQAPTARKAQVRVMRRLLAKQFRRTVADHNFVTTDGAIGVAATGSLDKATLRALMQKLPEGTWELVCHPGYIDSDLEQIATRLRDSRQVEVEALLDLPSLLSPQTSLVHFGALAQ